MPVSCQSHFHKKTINNFVNPFYTIYAALRIVRDYTGYASVRIYMRIHDSHHQLPGFAILKIKNKITFPMGLCEASFPLPASWGRHFSCDFKEYGVFSEC